MVAITGACFSCCACPHSLRRPCRFAITHLLHRRAADLLYVLKFILGDFCIVCTGFHVVNFSMLAVAIFEFRAVEDKDKTA